MTPQYGRWSDVIDDENASDSYKRAAYMMIYGTWLMWLFVNIFNVVILLNFLIAFISETYEEVYGRGKIDAFKNMAMLNYESRITTYGFKNLFRCKKESAAEFDYIVVTHATDYQIDEEDAQVMVDWIEKATRMNDELHASRQGMASPW